MDREPVAPSRSPGLSGSGGTKDQRPSIEFLGSQPTVRKRMYDRKRHYANTRVEYLLRKHCVSCVREYYVFFSRRV